MSNFRVPYLVGDKYQRDHQYWPTISLEEYNEITNGYGPDPSVQVSLEFLLHMAWRVREWELTSEFTFTGPTENSTFTISGTNSAIVQTQRKPTPFDPFNPFATRDVTDERDILGPASEVRLPIVFEPGGGTSLPDRRTLRNLGARSPSGLDETPDAAQLIYSSTDDRGINEWSGSDGVFEPPDPPPGEFFAGPYDTSPIVKAAGVNGSLLGYYVVYDEATKLFTPQIFVGGGGYYSYRATTVESYWIDPEGEQELENQGMRPHSRHYRNTASVEWHIQASATAGTLTIKNPIPSGLDIELDLAISGYIDNTADRGGSGVVTATLTPTKWWPYKNSVGDPVYDEDDGTQINDPLS